MIKQTTRKTPYITTLGLQGELTTNTSWVCSSLQEIYILRSVIETEVGWREHVRTKVELIYKKGNYGLNVSLPNLHILIHCTTNVQIHNRENKM